MVGHLNIYLKLRPVYCLVFQRPTKIYNALND